MESNTMSNGVNEVIETSLINNRGVKRKRKYKSVFSKVRKF